MPERPIIFSGDMVRAIIDGRKTMTRRVMKPQPDDDGIVEMGQIGNTRGIAYIRGARGGQCERVPCPYGFVGGHLWVREKWTMPDNRTVYYGADCTRDDSGEREGYWQRTAQGDERFIPSLPWRWTPSIHMPRWASRITLEIMDVRVERVQSINDEDALAEGIYPTKTGLYPSSPRAGFRELWDSLNAKRNGCAWNQNPFVWCISFRRLS